MDATEFFATRADIAAVAAWDNVARTRALQPNFENFTLSNLMYGSDSGNLSGDIVKTQMEALVASWLDYARQREALLDRITALVRVTDHKFEGNEDFRDQQMKALQRQFYRVVLAERLGNKPEYSHLMANGLLDYADELLAMRCHVKHYPASADMRNADEERMYTSLRVTWHNLLKKAAVRAVDNRGGPNNQNGRGGYAH